jgi:glycosyltransferase involved in cell wall biosynthesis
MKINFISNISPQEISGGFSAMNAAAYEALAEIAEVQYVGPVNPPVIAREKIISKLKRSTGIEGEFFFFSEARLTRIAEEVGRLCQSDADIDFYHGFTPWIRCARSRPYLAWSDCCFRDYLNIYHCRGLFKKEDVTRICSAENAWMRGASAILLSSEWARIRTKSHYGLEEGFLADVGIFGAVDVPPSDQYRGSRDFLFISTNYERKNGPVCRRAITWVWRKYPDARLIIIGAPPRDEDLTDSRVTYEGYLKKSNPEDLATLTNHFSRAFALLHPTNADTTAMVVIEAAFHGCPSITVNDFALPEVTANGAYALLQDRPVTAETLARAMIELLDNREHYHLLRVKAREVSIGTFTRAAFKKRLQKAVRSCIASVEEKRS